MSSGSLADRLQRQIETDGPIPVSAYVDAALYDPDAGFYATVGQAGRRGDFLTAPEVGPLFGAVVAGAIDSWWAAAGRPPNFLVHEWGAGPGTLARAVFAAEPEALTSGALMWVMVEASEAQRTQHPTGDRLRSVAPDAVAESALADLVVANELLDNLAFNIIERTVDGWRELRIGPVDVDGRFTLVTAGPVTTDAVAQLPDVPVGTRLPVQNAAHAWVAVAREAKRVVVFDYGADAVELAKRDGGWLRTHRAHDGRHDWLAAPGSCDITTDVAFDHLQVGQAATNDGTQAEWLRFHGIDTLVEEGRAIWEASASVGDLAALKARSRIREAEALLDPVGMGSFRVLEWTTSP